MPQTHIIGSLLGTAVGDALGLPYEGLSRDRAARMFGKADRYRFLFRYGMVSDDTEHACMVAQALIASGGEVDAFRRQLGRRLRFWLLALPAGIGLATLRSILRLWMGFNAGRSGVFSAGNGPAMRAPIIGAAIDDPVRLRELVRASTRITHTDPKAEFGAFAVALAAQMARRKTQVSGDAFLAQLSRALGDEATEFLGLVSAAVASAEARQSTAAFAESMGLGKGVTGYVYHTVPVAIHAWLGNQGDFRAAVMAMVECGGDTDSTAAIVGGIVGAAVGSEGIPQAMLDGLLEWPRSVRWMEKLGAQLGDSDLPGTKRQPLELPFVLVGLRNVVFLAIVLAHGFRRLLPRY